MRLRLLLAVMLAYGCIDETPPTASGDTDATLVAGCRECQAEACADYYAACMGDPECDACVDAPYGLACLSNANIHALGSCSCSECGNECDYLCPGPPGNCSSCGIEMCADAAMPCIQDLVCAPCLDDPFRPGCDDNLLFDAARECVCTTSTCGQACVWECPMAGTDCAGCLSTDCSEPFGTCMQDELCLECFGAPYQSECPDNVQHQALQACICGMCSGLCSVLFDCSV